MQFSLWQVYYCNSAISFFDGFRSLPCFSATSKRRTAVGLLLRLFREIFAIHMSGDHARHLRITFINTLYRRVRRVVTPYVTHLRLA